MQQELSVEYGWELVNSILCPVSPSAFNSEMSSKNNHQLLFQKLRISLAAKKLKSFLARYHPNTRLKNIVGIFMRYDDAQYLAPYLKNVSGKSVGILYDAWEPNLPAIADYYSRLKFDYLFVTAKSSAEYLAKALQETNVRWLPESLLDENYSCLQLLDRKTDVVQFGRYFAPAHEKLKNIASANAINYLCSENTNQLLFDDDEVFLSALGEARISICYARIFSHPNLTGSTNTMTLRYLQSMMSGCILIGSTPPEMIDLFGFNPVIEVTIENMESLVLDVVNNPDKYQEASTRNHEAAKLHLWKDRAKTLLNCFEA